MTAPASQLRVTVDGKFFRLGANKFYVKGVTYGPFAPNAEGEHFASTQQTEADFRQIRSLGANVIRIYYLPPKWLLDLAAAHELKVLVDIPWPKHLCFLDSEASCKEARTTVRKAVESAAGHPAVFAFSVVNEIPAEIVRWSGARAVNRFIDELVTEAKSTDPDVLCTFASFPPTEFLRATNIDFLCFNVYLHQQKSFESYLARLQTIAGAKPLILGEFGIDSIREGEAHQSEILGWHIESAFRAGLAGTVVFSFTDDWFRGGEQIKDWAFGLTTRDRQPKPSFDVVWRLYSLAPHLPLPRSPKVSVVVATYNGARTLKSCLNSLAHLNYPDYEVILVDDGSTDDTKAIAQLYPNVRYLWQTNHGLSVARNTGIAAATGEIVAFTDSDCRADEDWLYYLVRELLTGEFIGVGGHNFLPPEDSPVAAAVLVSPGGPAHVMITDREAEHIPGCNMAFYRWALDEIRGFDPVFYRAGDDVDVCWRLQERGYKIGFSAAGFVWHYRRATVRAYLQQQGGYGEAEALLGYKHPEYFNTLGGGAWRGTIYTASKYALTLTRPIIYHGLFGSGFFQKLYAPGPAFRLMFFTSLEYHVLFTVPLLVLSASFPNVFPVAVASLIISAGICVAAAAQAELPKAQRRLWSRPLIALLFLLQPIVRGWARYKWRLQVRSDPKQTDIGVTASAVSGELDRIQYWSEKWLDRYDFLGKIIAALGRAGWQTKLDTGWTDYDVEIFGSRWSRLRLTTVVEYLEASRTLLRCRLHAYWSLRAKVLFWAAAGAEFLAIGIFAEPAPWLWMVLLTLPILAWYLEYERRVLQRLIAALLDQVASASQVVRVDKADVMRDA